MSCRFEWINQPAIWCYENNALSVITDIHPDFWRRTRYRFERFADHIYATDVTGDFTLPFRIRANFTTLYDQAGIMMLSDKQHWLKAGIEFNDGAPAIGSVLTLGNSDWATGLYPGDPKELWLRLTPKKDALPLQYFSDGQHWPLLRLCHFPIGPVRTGVMCCTPQRKGSEVEFIDLRLTPAMDKELHDLS